MGVITPLILGAALFGGRGGLFGNNGGDGAAAALINDYTDWFHSLLCDYMDDAFTYGYNEGLNKANMKDTEMYKPTT